MIELPIIDAAAAHEDQPRQKFWRSVQQLQNDPAFKQLAGQEFMPGATDPAGAPSRRQFLQIMGASMALAGLTGCRRPVEKILPYTRKPEEVIPGIPLFFATAMPFRGVVRGLLVESHEGRPTKIEGNPEHPVMRGTTSLYEQASILNLYDPDRSRQVLHNGAEATWQDFLRVAQEMAVGAAGKRVAVLVEETSSPTLTAVRERLRARFPQLRWVTYSAEGDDAQRLGMQAAFGRPLRPVYHFTEADVIVSLDADFLSPTERDFVHNTRSYAESRKLEGPQDTLNRLYVIESAYTITGGKADNRLRLRASDIPAFASALAERLGLGSGGAAARRYMDHPYLVEIASDLQRAGGRGLVLAGDTQPVAVHALAAAINSALGSVGSAMTLLDPQEEPRGLQGEELPALVRDMTDGRVDALLVVGANPVYSAPAELNFAEAMRRVPLTVHTGLHLDETGQLAQWHIPQAHYLEAWGDGRAYDGTLSVIQPLIAPLYEDAKSDIEVLNAFATGQDVAGYDLVRETWRTEGFLPGGNFEQGWRKVLHDGFVEGSQYTPTTASASAPNLAALAPAAAAGEALEVVFRLDYKVLDGSYANNAWCQELPDLTTKIVWDNVARMSPATAERLGLEVEYDAGKFYADVIELSVGGGAVQIPVWIEPGLADDSVHVNFGYGRNIQTVRPQREARFFDTEVKTDIYGRGALASGVGVNVAPLRTGSFQRVVFGSGVSVRRTGEKYMIASAQEHGSMEGRPIVRYATLEEYRANPEFAEEAVPEVPGGEPYAEYPALWQDSHPMHKAPYKDDLYYRNQWGMVIDLNTCTGCSSCVVACNSENNVQMVGKEQVSRGREMHWLRIDRYYVTEDGQEGEPEMVFQPMLCVHCENAPCEPVCPVYATTHSPDGINEMTYNRCIGTRYCSNNCPYKVRRFNFFNWSKTLPLEVQMAQNPDVTVRFRGVMEKCTYCVQRVREAQRRATIEDRTLEDGEVLTACQQVCPADAIIFGDINDPTSKVSQYKQNSRRYEVLEALNTQPRTSYLGLVKNPNPNLVQARTATA